MHDAVPQNVLELWHKFICTMFGALLVIFEQTLRAIGTAPVFAAFSVRVNGMKEISTVRKRVKESEVRAKWTQQCIGFALQQLVSDLFYTQIEQQLRSLINCMAVFVNTHLTQCQPSNHSMASRYHVIRQQNATIRRDNYPL